MGRASLRLWNAVDPCPLLVAGRLEFVSMVAVKDKLRLHLRYACTLSQHKYILHSR